MPADEPPVRFGSEYQGLVDDIAYCDTRDEVRYPEWTERNADGENPDA